MATKQCESGVDKLAGITSAIREILAGRVGTPVRKLRVGRRTRRRVVVRVKRRQKSTSAGKKGHYAKSEYGVTTQELAEFSKRVHGQIEEATKAEEFVEFNGEW